MATNHSRSASLDLPGSGYHHHGNDLGLRRTRSNTSLPPTIEPIPSDITSSPSSVNKKPKDQNATTDVRQGQVLEISFSDEGAQTPSSSTDSNKLEEKHASSEPNQEPHHVFSRREKWLIVWIVSLAGLFSPLSSNIYFPALGDISVHTHTSLATVSLTITTYMIVQGLAPSFWGPLSDTKGRRLTFIGTFIVYLIANLGLALNKTFAGLMVFRAFQAFGGAATISVGAGVISDITTPKERGGFLGSFGGIRMLGQSIGPVIGGIITEYFGYHAIFYFLLILGSISLLLITLFLPETLRSIAGNGSVPLKGFVRRPVISSHIKKHWTPRQDVVVSGPGKFSLGAVLHPLLSLREKEVLVTLLSGGIVYAIWSMVTSTTTALFQSRFDLSDLETGLVFLPNGAACVSGAYVTGKLLDRDYRIYESRYLDQHHLDHSQHISHKHLPRDFPIIKARLRSTWFLLPIFTIAVSVYGFSLNSSNSEGQKKGMILPLMLQFVIAFTATAVFTQNSALMVDLFCSKKAASATAVNNLVRCGIGAGGVAVVQFIIDGGLGAGWTFFMFGGVVLGLCWPLMGGMWVRGDLWRLASLRSRE
ncbi:major facilitator superfamily domain-containing protein, partial [Podospora fimiseda]